MAVGDGRDASDIMLPFAFRRTRNVGFSRAFLPCKVLGNFPTSPSTCPTSPLVTANAPPVFCPFSVTVRHGRATCQKPCPERICGRDHLWSQTVDTYVLDFSGLFEVQLFEVQQYCIVTGGESGPRSAPSDPKTVPFQPVVPTSNIILKLPPGVWS